MHKKNFSFSEKTQKLKSKLLILSAVTLFIGLTRSLPTTISVIGLSLEGKEAVVASFIFWITTIFLIHFLLLSAIEIRDYYSYYFLKNKFENTTGDTLNLSSEDINKILEEEEYYDNEQKEGTTDSEITDIQRKHKYIHGNFTGQNVKLYNIVSLLMELLFPIAVACSGLFFLFQFMACL